MDLLKNLDNMITAEELSKNYTRLRSAVALKDLSDFAIEFAKLHVEAALKAASEKALLGNTENGVYSVLAVSKESILNAYSLENIK